MRNAYSEELKQAAMPSSSSIDSASVQKITRRSFLAASAVLCAVGGCAQSENADDIKSGEQIDALNNLITDSGWKCVQMKGYPIIGFVYDSNDEYSRTVFAHPNGTFTVYANSQEDSKLASGTTSIETWEADSIEKFNNVDEAAGYIISLGRSENE